MPSDVPIYADAAVACHSERQSDGADGARAAEPMQQHPGRTEGPKAPEEGRPMRAKLRQKRKGGHLRARKVADAALAEAAEERDAKRARDAPPSDEPPDDTEMT